MSYSTIMTIKFSKETQEICELRNSHGSAPVIWDSLCVKYLGSRPFSYHADLEKLWPIYKDSKIPFHHRVVLVMTFDRAYISKKNFKRAAADIRKYLFDFPPIPNYVNHWSKIADLLDECKENNFCIWHTSVSENPFMNDNRAMKKSDCFEVYEELALFSLSQTKGPSES